ncbi:peptidase inhibitor R3HDML-like [Siphateles boraxobius]|uniref:peptidase inhibitor R3HDML-like n=1 Tax=Siphateles boraxobius TaxID=180520 RepID=UPI004063D75E
MYLDVALWCAGIWSILSLANGQLTKQEESTIVDMHNKLRSQVQPSAAFMQKVVWDETLRVVAEAYAAKCIWKHNPDLEKLILGENLFVSTGPFNATKAMVSWFEENVDYNYENKSCPKDKMCGHYTQMVWADSNRIGCATQLCDTLEGLDFKKATLLVCDYSPAGNFEGLNPYVSGKPCSKCPENLPVCEEKICVSENLFQPSEEPDVTEDPTVLPELSQSTMETDFTEDPTVLTELSQSTMETDFTEDPTVLTELSQSTMETDFTEDPTVLTELSQSTTKQGVTKDPIVLPKLSHSTTKPVDVPREPTQVSVKADETGMEKTTKSHGSKMERVSTHLLMLIGIVLVL